MSNLIPGEIIPEQGEIELNLCKEVKTVKVSNSGDDLYKLDLIIIFLKLIRLWSLIEN